MLSLTVVAVSLIIGGLILTHFLPKHKWLIVSLLLVIVTPIVLLGFWYSDGDLGISDWDYYFSYHYNMRRTIVEFHQFPQWNPWTCGGTAAVGDPEFPVFSPLFWLELAFGIERGFRLAIFASVATTAVGMLMLGKRLGLSVYGALIAALAVAFGSVNLLEIVEGHPNVLSVMWLPWALWAWSGGYWRIKRLPWPLITGIFLALMFMQGGIYLLMYTATAFLVLLALVKRPSDAFLVSLKSGLWALGLSAIKIIPVALWLRQFQDQAYASSAYTLPYLHEIFLGRYLHRAGEIIANQGSGWHEYGAYIGPVILVLALISLIKVKNRLVRALLISVILATLLSASGPLLKPVFDQISFIPRSNISRVILFAVIPLSLLAGIGLDTIKEALRKHIGSRLARWAARRSTGLPAILSSEALAKGEALAMAAPVILILALAALDLFTLSHALSRQAFVLPDVVPAVSPAPSPIAFSAFDYKTRHDGDDFTRAYPATRAGFGSLTYCSVLGPDPAVRTIHDEDGSEIIGLGSDASFELKSWSPNKVVATITSPDATEVHLNSNYATGWSANNLPAKERQNRVSTNIPPGTHQVTFQYRAPGFRLGLIISILTIILATLRFTPTNIIKRLFS